MAKAQKRDYYATLGLPPRADARAIKAAYRELLKTCHPDVRPNDAEALQRFREIREAYIVLGGPVKRRLHDADMALSGARRHGLALTGLVIATASCVGTLAALGLFHGTASGRPPDAAMTATGSIHAPPAAKVETTSITGEALSGRSWPIGRGILETIAVVPLGAALPAEAVAAVDGAQPLSQSAGPGDELRDPGPPPAAAPVVEQAALLLPRAPEAETARSPAAPPREPAKMPPPPEVPVSAVEPSDRSPWRLFRDAASGFALRYPASLFETVVGGSPTGAHLLASADRRAIVRTYSVAWDGERSVGEFRRKLMMERYVGATMMLVSETPDRLVLGGRIGHEAFREIAIFSCDRSTVHGFVMVYSATEANRYEPMFDGMSNSLIHERPSRFRCGRSLSSGG